jgi:hypothetical protein
MVDLIPTLLPRYGRHPWLMLGLTAACDRLWSAAQADCCVLSSCSRAHGTSTCSRRCLAPRRRARGGVRRRCIPPTRSGDPRPVALGRSARTSTANGRSLRTAPEFAENHGRTDGAPNANRQPLQRVELLAAARASPFNRLAKPLHE